MDIGCRKRAHLTTQVFWKISIPTPMVFTYLFCYFCHHYGAKKKQKKLTSTHEYKHEHEEKEVWKRWKNGIRHFMKNVEMHPHLHSGIGTSEIVQAARRCKIGTRLSMFADISTFRNSAQKRVCADVCLTRASLSWLWNDQRRDASKAGGLKQETKSKAF